MVAVVRGGKVLSIALIVLGIVSTSACGEETVNPASTYALLGPAFARSVSDSLEAKLTVQRASEEIDWAPDPAREIHVEGVSSGEANIPGIAVSAPDPRFGMSPSLARLRDMDVMLDFALAWRLTGSHKFLDAATRFIDAWVSTYQLSFNPIDELLFERLILSYDLTEPDVQPRTRGKVDTFLRRMATGYIEAMETKNVLLPPTLFNNWQSHRIMLATLAAFQIGDANLINRAHALFDQHLAANLRPDGSTLDFAQRDALHYATFSVGSQLEAALAAQVHGQDWYHDRSADGRSLPNTLNWLAPYAVGEKTHLEFVHSLVPYDRQRAANGNEEFEYKSWDPELSLRIYILANLMDSQWSSLRRTLLSGDKGKLDRERGHDRFDWLLFFGGDRAVR